MRIDRRVNATPGIVEYKLRRPQFGRIPLEELSNAGELEGSGTSSGAALGPERGIKGVPKVELKELWTLKWYRTCDTAGRRTGAGGDRPDDWAEWMRHFKDY